MRTFSFKARNIGEERYLTYTMGEEVELDEDVLDYCEEQTPEELLGIIYEEDDDYDYLTYNVTELVTLEDYIRQEHTCEQVLFVLRNVAQEMISLKEQAIPLSYILLNRSFIYIDTQKLILRFICLPVESKGSLAAEFKGFVRQLLANMQYDVEEDLNYVGKLLTYINGDNFNLRGLIGLTEALMEEEGIRFEEAGAIDADGVEVVSAQEEETTGNIMDGLSDSEDAPLPEIGDDEEEEEEEEEAVPAEDDEEFDSILPAGMEVPTEETQEEEENISEEPEDETVEEAPVEETVNETVEEIPVEETPVQEVPVEEIPVVESLVEETEEPAAEEAFKLKENRKENDINVIKARMQELVGSVPPARQSITPGKSVNTLEDLDQMLDSKPPVVKRNVVKVNRAAIIQQTEAEVEAEAAEERAANGETEKIISPMIEDITDDINIEKKEEKPKSNSVLNKTVTSLVKDAVASVASAATAQPKALPYLIRISTNERIMINKLTFKLGKATRGVDYTIGGNGAISRQHAIIIQKEGVCYIRDNKSTNHTYVNDKMVEEGMDEILTHDSIVRLGDEEFEFKIR